jgi:hypothetical protein
VLPARYRAQACSTFTSVTYKARVSARVSDLACRKKLSETSRYLALRARKHRGLGFSYNVVLGSLIGPGTVSTGSHALALDTANGSTFTSTVIAGSLAVQGGDTQILDGVDIVAGATTLTNGALKRRPWVFAISTNFCTGGY